MSERRIGVIPFKASKKGPRVLMITSLTRSRWIFPKGVVRASESDVDTCHREAFEEAGVRGAVLDRFPFEALVQKSTGQGLRDVPVTYFPLRVDKEARRWPERDRRKRRWFRFADAPAAADHSDTIDVFRRFEAMAAEIMPEGPERG